MLSRRSFLAGAASAGIAGPIACGRRKPSGYSGFAFIANQEGRAIAAVDLTVFAVARHIRLDAEPADVVAHPTEPLVYALTREGGSVFEIHAEKLAAGRRARVARLGAALRISSDGKALFVLCRDPRRIVAISTASMIPVGEFPLAADPVDFDLSSDGAVLGVSYGAEGAFSIIGVRDGQNAAPVQNSGEVGAVRFRGDSKCLIAADLTRRMLALYDVPSRRPIVELPLALRPDRLCFNADRGQLFVTGEGVDGVVVVYPFHTPEVAETVLAGRSPGAMAASANPGYLFVASPRSNDVSILDIESRKVIAVTPVGTNPNYIAITPDSSYALVLNETSGDVAVIRLESISRAVSLSRRNRTGALFMMIPVGSKPVSAAVVPI